MNVLSVDFMQEQFHAALCLSETDEMILYKALFFKSAFHHSRVAIV